MNKKTFGNIFYVISKTWKYEKSIIIILLLQMIIGALVPLILIYLPTIILDGVIHISDSNIMVLQLISLLMALAICNFINVYINSIYEAHLLNNKIHFLTDLFQTKMELPYALIESSKGQNMYQYAMFTLLDDNQGISGMLGNLGALLSNVCGILLYMGIIVRLDLRVLLILLACSLLQLFILRSLMNKQHSKKDSWIEVDRKIDYLWSYISDSKNNKEIKMFSMQSWLSRVADLLIKERLVWIRKLADYDIIAAVSDIVLLIIRDGLAYFWIFRAITGDQIEISEFVFYFGAITGFSVFMTGLTSNLAYISQKSQEVNGYRDYIELNDSASAGKALHLAADTSLCIEFVDVSFRFSKESPYVLKNFNLRIEKGEKIALVGENGAGKTTIVKLICGLYKPTEGKILVNGVDIGELSQHSIGNMFAAVFQDIHILPMSVAENIAFGSDGAKNEDIKHCIEMSGLDGVFSDINAPLTKMLHPEGIVLSGGQEQKIALARAVYKMLYRRSAALILDEPTAALDSIAEKEYYETYNSLVEGKTSLFISHRLASTQFCDRIILLDAGKIAETGSHQQLIKKAGKYNELFEIQSRYYQDA